MTNGCDSSSCGLAPGVPAYYHTHTKKISHSTTKIYIVLGWILNYNAKKKKKKAQEYNTENAIVGRKVFVFKGYMFIPLVCRGAKTFRSQTVDQGEPADI